MESEIQLQLGSGAALDTDTYSWNICGINSGWNLLSIYVKEADIKGSPNLDAINWFSLSNTKTGDIVTRIDEIRIFDRYAGAVKYDLIINSGSGDGQYVEDEIINIIADEPPPAQEFIGWKIISGDPLFEDVYAINTKLRMSGSDVEVSANYKVLGIYLDDCDLLKDWGTGGLLRLNTTDQQEGMACIEFEGDKTDEYKKTFTTPYNTGASVESGRLEFWYYVSDPALFQTNNQVELGSAGRADQQEYNWDIGELSAGWNFISLEFSKAVVTEGGPDLSAINWFRLYHFKDGPVITRIDAIAIVDPNAGERYPLTVYSGSGDGNYFAGTEVSIKADAAPEGKMFDSWVIDAGNPAIENTGLSSTTLTMPQEEVIITASYLDIQNYTLTVNNGNGSGSFTPGETVMIFANPAPEGMVFDQWLINSGTPVIQNVESPLTYVTITSEDAEITATYHDPDVSAGSGTAWDQSLSIYPNPASTEMTIELNLHKLSIAVFDVRGQKIATPIHDMNLAAVNHKLTIPLTGMENGSYLIRINTRDRVFTKLLMVKR